MTAHEIQRKIQNRMIKKSAHEGLLADTCRALDLVDSNGSPKFSFPDSKKKTSYERIFGDKHEDFARYAAMKSRDKAYQEAIESAFTNKKGLLGGHDFTGKEQLKQTLKKLVPFYAGAVDQLTGRAAVTNFNYENFLRKARMQEYKDLLKKTAENRTSVRVQNQTSVYQFPSLADAASFLAPLSVTSTEEVLKQLEDRAPMINGYLITYSK